MGKKENNKRYRDKNKEKRKEYDRQRYLNNPDYFKKNSSKTRKNNPDKIKEYQDQYRNNPIKIENKRKRDKIYYENNKEVIAEKGREYRNKNKEKIKKNKREYEIRNREKCTESKKNWALRNPDKIKKYRSKPKTLIQKLSSRLRHRINMAIKGFGWVKSNSTKTLIGCSLEELKNYLENKFTKNMTWDNYGFGSDKWHIDHIIPLSSAKTQEEMEKLCHYTNLQPLWQKDNLSKGSKIMCKPTKFEFKKSKNWENIPDSENCKTNIKTTIE